MSSTQRRSKRLAQNVVITDVKAASSASHPAKKTAKTATKASKAVVDKPKAKTATKATKPAAKPVATPAAKESDKLSELEVGDKFPTKFSVTIQTDKEVDLGSVISKSEYVVIFAYPKASTPGCTRQARGFQANYSELQKLGAQVYGLSRDKPAAQQKFKEKHEMGFDLVADVHGDLISLLGCQKQPSGVKRSHFIFVNGVLRVKEVTISPEASVEGALAFVQEQAKNSKSAKTKKAGKK